MPAETDVQEPIRLYMEDANGTLYLAEQVGWIGSADRSGSRFGTRKMFDDDEPIFRVVEQQRAELGTGASEGSAGPLSDKPLRWWRFAVLRGDGIPAHLDGVWFDVDEMDDQPTWAAGQHGATVHATNRWEQREDGQVAVVYEWDRQPARATGTELG